MNKTENYSIGLEINEISAELMPSEISFSLSDSIFSLYSRASLKINDLGGYGLESRVFTPGSKIKFKFGYDENYLESSFVVNSMENQSLSKSGQLGGGIFTSLIHESFAKSVRKSQRLESTPSKSVEDLFNYKFEDSEIEKTKKINIDSLYRPLMTEEETLNKVLLPNSLSESNKSSAYFCFIDIAGKLNYKSFAYMMNADPSYALFQGPIDKVEYYYSRIISFLPFTEKLETMKDQINYELSFVDNTNLEYKTEKIEIANVNFGGYPIYKTDISSRPFFAGVHDSDFLERKRANVHFEQRNALLPDKAIITTPLFINFTSGKIITITTKYGEGFSSYSFSKKYLIERSSHIWDGASNQGISQLIVSKAFPEFPTNSEIEKGVY